MPTKKYFWLRVSRDTAISCATTIAKLIENVSEVVNFGPTRGAAKIVLQILETIKDVNENDEARIALMKRVVDFLLEIREHFDNNIGGIPQNTGKKMQEFESVLLSIHNDMKPTEQKSFTRRVIGRDKIRGDLAARETALNDAIRKLNFSLCLNTNLTTNFTLTQLNQLSGEVAALRCQIQTEGLQDRGNGFQDILRTEYEELEPDISQGSLSPKSPREVLDELLSALDDYDYTGRVNSSLNSMPEAAGSYSDIFRVEMYNDHASTARTLAIKRIRLSVINREEDLMDLTREMQIWSTLKHPNILPFVGFVLEKSSDSEICPLLISDWMENGTLLQYMQKSGLINNYLMVKGIARGLRYLHREGIIHGDMKSNNVLISSSGEPVLMDFGISSTLTETSSKEYRMRGTIRWMSPELFGIHMTGTVHHTKASDVWAFGMTILEVLTGEIPYADKKINVKVLLAILERRLPSRPETYELWKESDKRLWTLCESCWKFDARERPTMDKILEDIRAIE